MMGEEEVSATLVNNGNNQNKNYLKFKLTRHGPRWVPKVIAREPCAKKPTTHDFKDVKELEISSAQKELPKEVSDPSISRKENLLCSQPTMSKFKLKRCGDQWFLEVTARDSCAKKQANTTVVSTGQYSGVIQRTDGPSSSYVQNEPLDQRSYMDALGVEEGMIDKPRPCFSGLVRKQKKNSVGCTKKRRSNDLHRLLFSPEGLQDGTELEYRVKGEIKLKGYKHGNGIVCSHCNTKISPSNFEAHAERPDKRPKRQPYRYICTTNGDTLHKIALRLSNGQRLQSIVPSSSDGKCDGQSIKCDGQIIVPSSSDDECAVCGVGGDLIFCDGCHCAYHAVCLRLEGIPTRDRHCSRCTENIGPNGRDSSPFISQPDRTVEQPVYQPDGCVVCRAQDFSVDTIDELKLMQCYQCGKQYHVSCLPDIGLCDLKELSKDEWFCCRDCNSIHSTMQGLLLKENKVLLASVLEKHIGKGAANSMHWQILSGTSHIIKHARLLSKASSIFKESFKTIRSKTCHDLIAAAVNGKNISEQESRQIYCVVLIVDSVVSSAAVLRIISREIAELPVVATRKKYRGNGYFRALFSCIEQLLVSINVEKIVLPAAKEAESMWTNKLGFKRISDEQLSDYTKEFRLTMFSEVSMLEKVLQATI